MPASPMSDGALSIFVFAAYHALVSGEPVGQVVLDDGQGHRADPAGVGELEKAAYLSVQGERGAFTPEGAKVLESLVAAIRAAVPSPD